MKMKNKFKQWEEEVKKFYPKKEYSGIFESVLHLEIQLAYLRSEEGKKVLEEELGETVYLEQVRLQERNLKMRKAELSILKAVL